MYFVNHKGFKQMWGIWIHAKTMVESHYRYTLLIFNFSKITTLDTNCDNNTAAHNSKSGTVRGFSGATRDLLQSKDEDELKLVGQRK